MQNLNLFGLLLATRVSTEFHEIDEELRRLREEVGKQMAQVVMAFLGQPTSPQTTFEFEKELERLLREMGRQILEMVLNRLEPEAPESLPKHFTHQQQQYSRKEEKTNNRGGIGTRFGTIQLCRFSCEPLQEARDDGQKSFAPLEWQLGIVGGNATPALAERVGHLAVGHTQREVLQRVAEDHDVVWSVGVLRKVTAAVSEGMAEHLHQAQKVQLLDQTTLSDQLTRLLTEVLRQWQGCWPRLVYITDAGYHPTEYFEDVLQSLDDPRHPGRRMTWIWVVDFYHACEYLAKLAQVLFDDARASHAWLKRMRHWLKHEWRAVFRILHSAAKHRSQRVLSATAAESYRKAYNYLNTHQGSMDYCAYRRQGFPIGSGVTEAACKTVFTQRFKESGMTWKLEGGRTILVLRLAELSGVWNTAYSDFLQSRPIAIPITKPSYEGIDYAEAA
jgi:hypothetical protein